MRQTAWILFQCSFLSLILSSVFSERTWAQQYGAISTATVETGRAAIEPTESPILNPATIPYAKGYFFTSDYAVMSDGSEFTVGLTDNMPDTLVPTSLIYTQYSNSLSTNNPLTTQDLRLELASLSTKQFAFGIAARYKADTVPITQYRQMNLLLGSLFTLTPELGIALVVDNVFSPDSLVPMEYRLLPGLSAGINYNYKRVIRFKLDAQTATNDSLDGPSLGFGLEGHWNKWLVFRMGVRRYWEFDTNEFGAGIGFSGPKFAVHYGYLESPQQPLLSRQAIDLAVPIW
jgi:hypothetical protein